MEVTIQSRCGGATDAHGYKVLGDVADAYIVDINKTKQVLEIGRYTVGGIKGAITLVALATYIERGMGGHIAHAHALTSELAR